MAIAGIGRGRALRWGVGALLLLLLASRVAAVFTTSVNWDEFALLDRADRTRETHVFQSGGRPGLAVLALLPFVAECDDEIAVVRRARLAWLVLTLAFLGGVAALAASCQPDPRRRAGDALLAVGLLALVPAFLEWSVQVRSDQLALAAGTWGGVALLASQRRPAWALAAGLLLGLGYLGSQKLLYVAVLVGLLAAGRLLLARELRPGRELLRAALCVAAFAGVCFAFGAVLDAAFDVPEKHVTQHVVPSRHVARSLSIFDFYRETLGWSQYRALAPMLVPHALLLLGLGAASVAAWRRRAPRGRLALAWALLAAGAAVGWFHAAAFFYFWMTLGLFPATAFAVARRDLEALVAPLRLRGAAVAGWWLALLIPGLAQAAALLADSQAVQRESFAFIHRNWQRDDVGWHPERGLFCQEGVAPIQTHFSQTIYRRFESPHREANMQKMIGTFRAEPVQFILQSFRLNQFPVELRRFWAEHYQPYRASVFVAGRRLEGDARGHVEFELLVTGAYRWLPYGAPHALEVDGHRLEPGAVRTFEAGPHAARFVADQTAGILVLAVDDPPGPAPLSFYKAY